MDGRMKRVLLFPLLLLCCSAVAQLHQYKATVVPRAGENIAQSCEYQASFPAGDRAVKAAWVTYDRGPDITRFYSDPDVLVFAKRNDVAMVLAFQCPAIRTGEKGEMDMYPEHGLGRSLFYALDTLGNESAHPELGRAKLIILGFSGTGALFGHFLAYAPDRVLAAILTNPGQTDPDNIDKISLDAKGVAVPILIIVGGVDTVSGTVKPYDFYKRYQPQGAPWIYLVQNNVPHCCIIDSKSFMLDWLQEVIESRHPDPKKPLSPVNWNAGWYGSIQPCEPTYKDHWGLSLWNVCDAHVERAGKPLPSQEMPAGIFPTESLAREWLAYVKQPNHPKNSFPRPNDPSFGEPEELRKSPPVKE
jgi:predicted esterase